MIAAASKATTVDVFWLGLAIFVAGFLLIALILCAIEQRAYDRRYPQCTATLHGTDHHCDRTVNKQSGAHSFFDHVHWISVDPPRKVTWPNN